MKKLIIIGSLMAAIMLSSCESNRTEHSTSSEATEITMDNPFDLTVEDLREEKLEVEKELTELKNSEAELKAHDIHKFQPEISQIEKRIYSLSSYITEFTNAPEGEKSEIYDQYKLQIESILEDIESIEDRFNDLKVMEN
jgi:peptidoglycan hydrolase CwlO-like protein